MRRLRTLRNLMLVMMAALPLTLAGCSSDSDSTPQADVSDVVVSAAYNDYIGWGGGTFAIHATVLDGADARVANLDASNFRFENMEVYDEFDRFITDVTATVDAVTDSPSSAQPGQPIVSTLNFDSSGSMRSNDPNRLRVDAGKAYVNIMAGTDFAAITDFSPPADHNFTKTRLLQDFTTDKTLLRNAIDLVTEDSVTPLYASLFEVIPFTAAERDASQGLGRILCLTDGEDNDSAGIGSTDVISQAMVHNIPISFVALGTNINLLELITIATSTGGGVSIVRSADQLQPIFEANFIATREGYSLIEATVDFPLGTVPSGMITVTGDLVVDMDGVSKSSAFELVFDL